MGGLPRLYQKYVGHDNNRDFYMSHAARDGEHEPGAVHGVVPAGHVQPPPDRPAGTVMFAPPFRDPVNYNFHPLITTGLDVVGAAMHNRFVAEDKGGRGDALRRQLLHLVERRPAHHGVLPQHDRPPDGDDRQPDADARSRSSRRASSPSADLPLPVKPRPWHFRQSIDYSVTANNAVLDVASRNREHFLFNIWKMGNDRIAQGQPRQLDDLAEADRGDPGAMAAESSQRGAARAAAAVAAADSAAAAAQRRGEAAQMMADAARPGACAIRAPTCITADQPDFPTAVKFIARCRRPASTCTARRPRSRRTASSIRPARTW